MVMKYCNNIPLLSEIENFKYLKYLFFLEKKFTFKLRTCDIGSGQVSNRGLRWKKTSKAVSGQFKSSEEQDQNELLQLTIK